MLLAVAGSILTSLATYPEAVAAELPMVALASRLNGTLGTVYGLMLLVAMFCNALASLVGLISYLEQKARFVRKKKKPVLAGLCLLAWAASLLGFGEIIAVVYPVFGYLSIVFVVCVVIHFVQARKRKRRRQLEKTQKEARSSSSGPLFCNICNVKVLYTLNRMSA